MWRQDMDVIIFCPREKQSLRHPRTDEYKVPIRLYKDVEPEITVNVIAEEKEGK
jgi:hypothetical protein